MKTDSKDESLVDVHVTVVGGQDAVRAMDAVGKFGLEQSSYDVGHQKVVRMTVRARDVVQIAKLPDVIWIEKVERKVLLDEVQDLILAGQTNGLGNGPSTTVGITNYLDFLVNSVGGGMASFFDPNTYPIVDVADTGIDLNQPSLLFGLAYAEPTMSVPRQIAAARA